jgi:hypothetical protein
MSIKVVRETGPVSLMDCEECFRCFKRTAFWFEPKDVACCQQCAVLCTVDDVPTKQVWFDAARARTKDRKAARIKAGAFAG